ncbi:MAG TPA: hypothetical protein VKR79_10725 [Gaiellaceae bacterium]|nr:hypothetical protein [Gaiellaceae bacterium]
MRKGLIATAVASLALAAPAAAGLPRVGTLVPGRSLGGVRLGETQHAVRASLGRFYGVCTDCARPTWYVTYGPFDKRGLAVEFARGRVWAVYTLWEPIGWYATNGLHLAATPLEVHSRAGGLRTITCPGYDALVQDSGQARSVYYLYQGGLWGFGLFHRGAGPCR